MTLSSEDPIRQRGRSALRRLFTAALLACSCSRAAPQVQPEGAPEAAPPPPPAAPAAAAPAPLEPLGELERAEAELDQARAELNASLAENFASAPRAAAGGARKDEGANLDRAAPRAHEKVSPKKKASEAAPAQSQAEAERPSADDRDKGGSACERSCKAFASLERAKSAICRLDTPSGARCGRAEGIVREAESRVASCACPR
jgi:hypothetical protein